MNYIFKHTFQVLSSRKWKFFLTALAIALGISLIVQTQIIVDTFERNYKEIALDHYGNADIIIYHLEDIYFEQDVYNKLVQSFNSEFQGIFPQIRHSTTVYHPSEGQFEQGVNLETIGSEFDTSFWGGIFSTLTGEELDVTTLTANETIISEELANLLKADIGDILSINLLDEEGNPIPYIVTVNNIYSYKGYGKTSSVFDSKRVLLNHQAIQPLIQCNQTRPITRILVGIEDHEKKPFLGRERTDNARTQIEQVLDDGSIGVWTWREDDREALEEGMAGLGSLFNLFGFVVILSGLLLIINIQLMNIEEQKQQLGILRAVGAKKRDILTLKALETILLGVTAGFLGLIIGMGIAILFNAATRDLLESWGNPAIERSIFDVVINTSTLTLSLMWAIGLAIISGMMPALRARGISIVEIIRGNGQSRTVSYNDKKPLWPLIIGGLIIILALNDLITLIFQDHPFYSPEGYRNLETNAADNLQALVLFAVGLIFISFRYKSRSRLLLTIGGLLMIFITVFGFQFAIKWIEEGGNGNRIAIIGLLSAVAGATTVIGANLDTLTAGLRKILSFFTATRSTGLVATRYINSRKTRAVLTFATFAVVLSLSSLMSTFAQSQTYGTETSLQNYLMDVSMVVESELPMNLTILDYPSILQNRFDTEITRIYPLATAYSLYYQSDIESLNKSEDLFACKLVAFDFKTYRDNNGNVLFPFLFWDLVPYYSQVLPIERNSNDEATRREAVNFWEAFISGQKLHRETLLPVDSTDPKGLPMCIGLLWGVPAGDIVTFPLKNGSLLEMVYAADVSYFPSFHLHINEYISGVILSDAIASQLDMAYGYGVSEFLVETDHGFDNDKNDVLGQKIEEFSNKQGVDTLRSLADDQMYGITTNNIWEVIYHDYRTNAEAIGMIEIFISIGLIIGVFGL
ncbi:MAG: ABC transporter permease, partial [Candidatus Hodarchaeota archaeon]